MVGESQIITVVGTNKIPITVGETMADKAVDGNNKIIMVGAMEMDMGMAMVMVMEMVIRITTVGATIMAGEP